MSSNVDSPDTRACAYTDYREGEVDDEYPKTGEGTTGLEAAVWKAIYGVEDPEMPVSIVDLGLIYGVKVADGHAHVEMTLTYSGCPARNMLQRDVQEAVLGIDGIEEAEVNLRYSPQWSVDMVTEEGRKALREFGLSL